MSEPNEETQRPERPTCATCPYADMTDQVADTLECRRYAPSPLMQHDTYSFEQWPLLPLVLKSEFCGEHPDFPAYIDALRAAERKTESVPVHFQPLSRPFNDFGILDQRSLNIITVQDKNGHDCVLSFRDGRFAAAIADALNAGVAWRAKMKMTEPTTHEGNQHG